MKKKSNAGRKGTITGEIEAKLEKYFRIDATDAQACIQAGCSTDAYYRKLAKDERFRKRMEAAQDYLHIKAKEVLAKKITAVKNNSHAAWFLERRERKRYATRVENKNEGSIAVTYAELEGKIVAKSPDEALRMADEMEFDDEEE